jgi:preprotein translocase subunit YajC
MNQLVSFALIWAMSPPPTDPNQPAPPFALQILPFVLMFVVFYFVLIRPQSKARKEQEKLVNEAKVGDQIITSGGIVGSIANVKDRSFMIKVADNVRIEVLKSHVTAVTKETSASKAA